MKAYRTVAARVVAGWAGCVLAGSALAADLAAFSLEQLVGMEVSSASRYAQQAIDAPAAVSRVTAEDIRSFGYRTLADVLNGIRGLHTTNDRNYDYLGARGFATPGDYNTRTLLLVDGARYNDSAYDQASIGTDFNIDLALIDRIEYVSGPGSSVYGPNAFFGVINVITKRPTESAGGQVAIELGTQRTAAGSVRHSGTSADGIGWLVSATRSTRAGADLYFPELDAPATNNGVAQGRDSDRYSNLFGRLVVGDLTLTATHGERIKGIPTASYGQVFNDGRSRTGDSRDSMSLAYSAVPLDRVALSARFDLGRFRYTGDYVYDYPPTTINRDETFGSWWGGEVQATSTLIDGHTMIGGAEYRRDTSVKQRNFDVDPYFSYLDSKVDGRVWGIYAQDDMRLAEAVSLSAGLRYNHHSTSGGALNPRLGLIWKPRPVTALKLLYGSAYRPPNAYESSYITNSAGGTKVGPVPLKAETIRSTEFVLEHAPAPGQRLLWTVFRNQVDDQIVGILDPADGLTSFQNSAGAIARGTELEMERRWDSGVRVKGSLSLQRVTDRATGSVVTHSPRRLLKMQVSGPLPGHHLRYGIEAIGVDRRLSLAGEVPGYLVMNANLLADRVLPGVDLSLGISNLFNQAHFDPGGTEHLQDRLARDGRTVRLRAVFSF